MGGGRGETGEVKRRIWGKYNKNRLKYNNKKYIKIFKNKISLKITVK